MPVVDYENAWFALKAKLSEKRSWGTTQIAEEMASIEVGYRLPEGQEGFDDRPLPPSVRDRQSKPALGEPVATGSL